MAGPVDLTREPTVEELRERVDVHGRRVSATVEVLGQRVERTLDWRERASRHPWLLAGAAACAGLAVARLLRRRASPGERALEGLAGGLHVVADRLRHPSRSRAAGRGLAGVARAVLVAAARGALRRALPSARVPDLRRRT